MKLPERVRNRCRSRQSEPLIRLSTTPPAKRTYTVQCNARRRWAVKLENPLKREGVPIADRNRQFMALQLASFAVERDLRKAHVTIAPTEVATKIANTDRKQICHSRGSRYVHVPDMPYDLSMARSENLELSVSLVMKGFAHPLALAGREEQCSLQLVTGLYRAVLASGFCFKCEAAR